MDDENDVYLPRDYNINDKDLPDEGYDVDLMEKDGKYETEHSYYYEDLKEEIPPPKNLYNGPGPCLKRGIAECLKTLLDAVSICGGFDYNFVKRVTVK